MLLCEDLGYGIFAVKDHLNVETLFSCFAMATGL